MKKRMVTLLMALCLLVGLVPFRGFAAELSSEIAIAPQYEDAKNFSDGYAAVKKDGKWGYIDESGNVVVDFKYDWAGKFSEGVAITMILEERAYGYGDTEMVYVAHLIDTKGMDVVLIDHTFDYESGGLITQWYDEEYGGMDPDTELSLDTEWFCNDGVVYAGGCVYRKDGSQILPISYDDLFKPEGWGEEYIYFDYVQATGPCVGGVIPMYAGILGGIGYRQCFYMDTQGNIIKTFAPANEVIGEGIYKVFAPDDGRILVQQIHELEQGEWDYYFHLRLGVMDMEQNWILEPAYIGGFIRLNGDYYTEYGTLTLENESNYWGAVGLNGEILVDFDYAWMGIFSQGYAPAQREDGTCIYLDTQGNTYQIGGIDGGIANVSVCGSFNDKGVAAVYDATTGTAYCILNQPVDGVFPAIRGSELINPSVYFPGYSGTGSPTTTSNVEELVVIEEDGLYGYLRLNLKALVNPFTDVNSSDYYYTPVLWALEKGITSGTSDTAFSPYDSCLRSQVVTFLWRAAGKPAPKSQVNPFVDVKPTDYYYNAVLWAVENGITYGADSTHFEPNGVCNRSQVVSFLYRAFENPPVEGTGTPFKDVQPGAWYASAVQWAVKEGIAYGLSESEFGPNDTCNRSQVVTFLYRAYN